MRKRTQVAALQLLLAICLFISACGTKQNIPVMNVNYYPQCYKPFEDLKASENEVAKKTVASATLGGILGAGIGALTGGWKAAAIGGAAGMALGGVGGYYSAKKQQIKDDRERLASYQADMNQDMISASRAEKYSLAAMQCYAREFDNLLLEYKYGRITKLDAENRYKEIREGMSQIATLLKNTHADLLQKDAEYRNALSEEAKAKNAPAPRLSSIDSRGIKSGQTKKAFKSKLSRKQRNTLKKENRLELAELTYEIENRKADAEARPAHLERAGAANRADSLASVSSYYETRSKESVERIEQAQNMRERTLLAMSNAAANAGIDMI